MVLARAIVWMTICFICVPASALSQTKLALIITNQSYAANPGALQNPHRDGERLAAALTALGFQVAHKRDLKKDAMVDEVAAYALRLAEGGAQAVGFFYYSGHGAASSVTGDNYLIPVGAPVGADVELPLRAVKLGEIIETIKATPAKTNFIVFDACREVLMSFAAEVRH